MDNRNDVRLGGGQNLENRTASNKKQITKITIFITSIFIIFMGVTYGFISLTVTGTKKQVITAGTLDLVLEEDSNNITLTDAMPMYDEVGMIQDPFTFRLVNRGTADANYIVKLVEVGTGTLTLSDVKYGLEKDGAKSINLLSTLTDGVVDSGVIKGNQTINYTLRLWIKDTVTENSAISGKNLSYKVNIETSQIIMDENGCPVLAENKPNAPELTSGMIPVVYDESAKTWKKADTTSEWYNYSEQMWANAVTVTETNRTTYMNASAGTPISMDDINTMWVWIPRYSYTIRDTYGVQLEGGSIPSQTTPGAIDIQFISSNQKDNGTGKCEKCAENWVTPEGFTFGDENIPGFWIGKFETTGSITTACTDENCTTADLTIKPNLSSVISQTVSSMFYASRSMQNSVNANKYGFEQIGTGTMDTHMLKNTEWGIVAMLSQSKYGKYGNLLYSGMYKEVYKNDSSAFYTGRSSGNYPQSGYTSSGTYQYDDLTITTEGQGYVGAGASTTGTIYGVYDMSGGAYEYVMGNYNLTSRASGFITFPEAKYFDNYTSNLFSEYKFGDTIYETMEWYGDYSDIIKTSYPWFERGGKSLLNEFAGVFFADFVNGNAIPDITFRLTLKP